MPNSNKKPVTRRFREFFKRRIYRGLGKGFLLPKMSELSNYEKCRM